MVEKKIYLKRKMPPAVLDVVQGVIGEEFSFEVMDITLDPETEARIYIEKPSGLTVYQEAELSENTVSFEANTQTFIEPGTSKMVIQFIKDESVLYSFVMLAIVQRNPAMNEGGSASENYDYFLKGEPGKDGQSVSDVIFNSDGTITVVLPDGTTKKSPVSVRGEQGPKGDTGPAGSPGRDGTDGQDGTTFTPSVSDAGVISWTNDGGKQNPPERNIKGPAGNDGIDGQDGTTFTPSVSDAGIISWTNDGGKTNPPAQNIKGPTGRDGIDGQDGTTFTPSVSSTGVISWTNDGGKTNPPAQNIKGPAGDTYILTNQDKEDIADIVIQEIGSADTMTF